MKKFVAGKYKQQQEYRSFTPSFVNNRFIWDNPQIDVLIEQLLERRMHINCFNPCLPSQ